MQEKDKKVIIAGWLDLLKGLIPRDTEVELPVLSGSMAPVILPGKYIRICPASIEDVHVGDIIVFKEKNTLTIHRMLIRIPFYKSSPVYQKGDANAFGNWIKGTDIVGKVEAVSDDMGVYNEINSSDLIRNVETIRQIIIVLLNYILIFPRFIQNARK